MTTSYLSDVLALLGVTVAMVALFRWMRLPAVIAYLLVGTAIGPNGLAWLSDAEGVKFMAELGIMFLMFLLGLEFSLPVLLRARNLVFIYGGAQVVITALLAAGVAYLTGLPLSTAIAVGGALAMSSTAVLIKQLSEQGDLNTRHGRMVIGVLLFQDLATLPFLVAVPILALGGEGMSRTLSTALFSGAAIFMLMVVVGRWFASQLLRWVAGTRSVELFLLTALLLIAGSAAMAEWANLPQPLGAFLAGMVIGETPYRHQVESDIRPFQDVLLGLFFITVGMWLDPPLLMVAWGQVLLLMLAIVVAKAVIFTAIGIIGHAHMGVVLRAGVCLAHVGEFGLLLTSLSMSSGLLPTETGQVLLAAMVLSMMLAPLFVRWNYLVLHTMDLFGYRQDLARQDATVQRETADLGDHIILCGYGRVGRNLARFLEAEQIPFLALDLDAERVRRAQAQGKPVLYGDAGRYSLLKAAGLGRAKALAVTFRDRNMTLKVVRQIRQHSETIPTLVRARNHAEREDLEQVGATDVITENLESSLVMGAQLLLLSGVPTSRVDAHRVSFRGNQYRPLVGLVHNSSQQGSQFGSEHPRAIQLRDHAFAVGHRLAELELKQQGVELLAVYRSGNRVPEASFDTPFRKGDTLVIFGPSNCLDEIERRLLVEPKPMADSG